MITKMGADLTLGEYSPPLEYRKLPIHLKKDPIHQWRARSGVELIHKEPHREEFARIVANWKSMPPELKQKSDRKSIKLFGQTNMEHAAMLEKYYSQLGEEITHATQ